MLVSRITSAAFPFPASPISSAVLFMTDVSCSIPYVIRSSQSTTSSFDGYSNKITNMSYITNMLYVWYEMYCVLLYVMVVAPNIACTVRVMVDGFQLPQRTKKQRTLPIPAT